MNNNRIWVFHEPFQGRQSADYLCVVTVDVLGAVQPCKHNQWLRSATQSRLKEFVSSAQGLSEDYGTVINALRCEWSNGQLEGQINRLKFIKRQVYGRAKFDLLRARVLHSIASFNVTEIFIQ
jgi:hypothetical protein